MAAPDSGWADRRALRTRVCSHFQVPAPIAARIQRTQVPFPGQAHAIGRQRRQAGFVECEAGAYQVATASLTRDVVVRRWALDEQLTEDADGAGRQLKLARDPWLAVAHCCTRLSGRGDRSASCRFVDTKETRGSTMSVLGTVGQTVLGCPQVGYGHKCVPNKNRS